MIREPIKPSVVAKERKPRKKIICKDGQEFVEETQSCLKKCDEETQFRNPKTKRCNKKIILEEK